MRTIGKGLLLLALACAGCRSQNRMVTTSNAFEVTPSHLDFGTVATGDQKRLSLLFDNPSYVAVQVTAATFAAPFVLDGFPAQGLTLAPGEQRSFDVIFSPSDEGTVQATATIANDSPQGGRVITLTGEGAQLHLGANPQSIDLGDVRLGTYKTVQVSLYNDSTVEGRTTLRVIGPDAAQFSVPWDATTGIPPGQDVSLSVTYRPTHLGAARASALYKPCPTCGELAIDLSGTGIASCLALQPSAIDFGALAVGQQVSRDVTIAAAGEQSLQITSLQLLAADGSGLQLSGTPTLPSTLLPSAPLHFNALFAPTVEGRTGGVIHIEASGSTDSCWAEIPIAAKGGTSCVAIAPAQVDFGTIAVGANSRRKIYLKNLSCSGPIWLEGLALEGPAALTAGASTALPQMLNIGDLAELNILFAPNATASYAGTLRTTLTDSLHLPLADSPGDVVVTGAARAFAPCQLSVAPPKLDFGTVGPGQRAALAYAFKNVGNDQCFVSGLALSQNSDPSFSLALLNGAQYDTLNEFVLAPGESRLVEVDFAPTVAGSYSGAVGYFVSNPDTPFGSLPVTGTSAEGCLGLAPQSVDFGAKIDTCPTPTNWVVVSNLCTGPLTIDRVIPTPVSSPTLSFISLPVFPITLGSSQSLTLNLGYAPTARNVVDLAAFEFDWSGKISYLSARGAGLTSAARTDAFTQTRATQVDVLFVLDNSGSMTAKQVAVGQNLKAFLSQIQDSSSDIHLAVTTTGIDPATGSWTTCPGGVDGGEAGRFFPVVGSGPRILSLSTPGLDSLWATNTNVGICHWKEQGLEAALRALTAPLATEADDPTTPEANDGNLGFLRPDAKLAVVFVSDEEDQSPRDLETYFQTLVKVKKDPSLVSFSAIVTPDDLSSCRDGISSGDRYMELAKRTGGVSESICTQDWAASLSRIGQTTFGASPLFALSSLPADPNQIVVQVDGVVRTAWIYIGSINAILFAPGAVPPPGAKITIAYNAACPAGGPSTP